MAMCTRVVVLAPLLVLLCTLSRATAYDAHSVLLRDGFEDDCTESSCQLASLSNWKVLSADEDGQPGLVEVTAVYNAYEGSYALNLNGGGGLNANELHSVPLQFTAGVRYELSWAISALHSSENCTGTPLASTLMAGIMFEGWGSSVPFSFAGPFDPSGRNLTWATQKWSMDSSLHYSGAGTVVLAAPMDHTASCGLLLDALQLVALGASNYN